MQTIDQDTLDRLLPPNAKTYGLVWQAKAGWPIQACSESARRVLGLTLGEVQSQKIRYQSLIHPDDVDRVMKAVFEAFTQREAADLEPNIEYRLKSLTGDWIWVESETFMSILESEQGTTVVGFLRDVTDRHKAESALRKNQDRLEIILEGSNLGMWDWNPQTNEVICDRRWANQIGLSLDGLNMKLSDWSKRVHPDDMEQCLKDIHDHIDGKTPVYTNVHRMKHEDGHWVHILDCGQVVERDKHGKATKFIGTHTDISNLKKMELEAVASLHARDRFFSSMSHELRTPLHAILGIVELLEDDLKNTPQQPQVRLIRESGEYLLNVLKDILDVAKMEEGELTVSLSKFNAATVLKRVAALFESRAKQKSLPIVVDIPEAVNCGLKCDRTRLAQILVNLVSNAVKYTETGQIRLTASEQKGDLVLTVSDTGQGIADIDEVFQPFQQGTAKAIDDVHTTGLGLTIVKRLCKTLSLDLEVDSQVGKGSEFSVIVPSRFRRNVAEEEPEQFVVEVPIDWSSIRVLLVDDNKVNQVVAQAMLNSRHVQVDLAANGLEALACIKDTAYDIICMDLHMPELGGLSATRKIRQLRLNKQPRIVGVSADAYHETIEVCLEAGMDDYLTKPFKRDELFQVLKRMVVKP